MKFIDFQEKIFELTVERKQHICIFHPDLIKELSRIKEVLRNPDTIKKSRHDVKVLLYYKYFPDVKGGKYIAVVVKRNRRNFILTTYLTDKIKTGVTIYEKANPG